MRSPWRFLWILSCWGLLFPEAALPAAPQEPGPQPPQLRAELRDTIARLMAEADVPGLALAVVDRDGVLWEESFGFTDRTGRTCVTPRTPFSVQAGRVGSVPTWRNIRPEPVGAGK